MLMRFLVTIIFVVQIHKLTAQTTIDSSAFNRIQYPVKGFVLLNNGEKIMIEGISFVQQSKVVLFSPGSNILNGAFTYKGDIRTMQIQAFQASELRKLKVKRQSFATGAAYAGGGGFALGYITGAVSYTEDIYKDEEDNRSSRNARGLLFGIGVGIPTSLVGGFIGGLFIKKRFQINGDALRLESYLNKVLKHSL